ncbi:MAG: hypothetical protein IJV56_10205, partial [Neisseriaceae bacterium]|nr:hypothetical protein [Neisseriaceae bacterium]
MIGECRPTLFNQFSGSLVSRYPESNIVNANATDINIIGGDITADRAVLLNADKVNIASTTASNQDGTTVLNQIGTVQVTGKADNGVIYINAQDKISTNAANIENNAKNGETVLTAKDIELGTVTLSHKEKFGEISDKNHRIVESMQEVGTNVHGNGDIKIIANSGSLKGTAVNVDSTNGTATLYGEKSVDIKDGRHTLFLDEGYETKSRGILSSKSEDRHYISNSDEAVTGFIGGNQVLIQGKGDVTVRGTDLVAVNTQ